MSDDDRRRRGVFLVVVGPDGVGKSSLADALLEQAPGPSGYFHFRPPLRGPLPGRVPPDDPAPKRSGSTWKPMGWVRILVAFVRFWLGYLTTVRPLLLEGGLVVGDRWAYGYLVQPEALRYGGPDWLARRIIGLLPSPDVVVNLVAPVDEIRKRKQELSEAEIGSEIEAWRQIPARDVLEFEAVVSPESLAASILAELSL